MARAAFGPRDPHADALLAPLAAHVEIRERADQPFFKGRHEQPHVRPPLLEMQHEIDHALAGTMVCELATPSGLVDREARRDQAIGLRAGARRIERRVFEQPHQLRRVPSRNRGHAVLHNGERLLIRHKTVAHAPFDRRKPCSLEANFDVVADVNHRVTIPW